MEYFEYIKDFCFHVRNNKNLLMFITVAFYIIALVSVFHNLHFVIALTVTLLLSALLLGNLVPPKYILVWILVFYIGIINSTIRIKDSDELLNIAPVNATIYGKIISIPQDKGEGKIKFFFNIKKLEYDGLCKNFDNKKVFVTINTNQHSLKLNNFDSYKIQGRLALPFKAGNPSQFDYGNYLKNFSTYSVFYANSFDELNNRFNIEKIQSSHSLKERFLQRVNKYREDILSIHSQYLKTPNLEILGGVVFGDDAVSTPENIKKSFINSGLLHILAASGMNVAFIFVFFNYFLSLLKLNYKVNISICILMVLIYSLMTGLGASVIRATFMLVFVLIGKLMDRDAHSISLLSFVAFLMLLYNPMYLNDVGFQLSFIVTFGLLVTTPYLPKTKNKIINWLIGTICIPIIAQLWVIPIQIFYFSNISLYSVLANIMSVPMLSIISFGGFISSLLSLIKPVANIICQMFDYVLNPLITSIVWISDFWSNLPYSALQTTHPNIVQILIYYTILIGTTFLFKIDLLEKYRTTILKTIPIMSLILIISFIPIKSKNLEITAFDVGNADSFLIKVPSGKYFIIDTAKSGYNGGKSQAEIIILKYLKDVGIKKIDSIIITHFDNDHCGGTVDLLKNLNVKNIYINDSDNTSNAVNEIYKTAKENNVKIIVANNNQNVYSDNDIEITNYISSVKSTEDNENSIFTLLKHKSLTMLFTGDGGIESFNNIKNYIPRNITFLKVGHHGGIGSIDQKMATYLNPKYAIISVGENKFGHPNPITTSLLKNSKILRTDIHNSIKIVADENSYTILGYNTKYKKYLKLNSSKNYLQ